MDKVTQLHRLTIPEVEVLTLFRQLTQNDQEFILCLLDTKLENSERQNNVVRLVKAQ